MNALSKDDLFASVSMKRVQIRFFTSSSEEEEEEVGGGAQKARTFCLKDDESGK